MTDQDLDNIYKQNLPVSHGAGLRGVFDAGYFAALQATVNAQSTDASQTASVPAQDVAITTP